MGKKKYKKYLAAGQVRKAPRDIQNEVFGVQYTNLQLYLLDKIWATLSMAQVEIQTATLALWHSSRRRSPTTCRRTDRTRAERVALSPKLLIPRRPLS